MRLALLGTSTTAQLGASLRLAAAAIGVDVVLYECEYAQYRQDILDEASELYRFAPDTVVLAVDEGALALPAFSDSPDEAVAAELRRWTGLWEILRRRLSCRILQFTFALDDSAPMGHLAARLSGARAHMIQAVNLELGRHAGADVALVDCDRLSALFGKEAWFDPRFWIRSKQSPSLAALPLLARHVVAVLGAELGLSRKCLVLDLDNTLWGGVIGEDGLAGIRLGGAGEGEAFVMFQDYVRQLQQKGVVLAVVSKNNDADAREPFVSHPEMRLSLDDVAVFLASWDPKPDQIRRVADTLNLGLDSLVFVDDNPVERQAVRTLVPEVDVVTLPPDPALYVRALSQYLHFETAAFTAEDAQRTEQYRARELAAGLESSAETLEEFVESLGQHAELRPFNDVDLARIHQLVGKTNQFNLTTPRYSREQIAAFMDDSTCLTFSMRLRDRFTDHGLVSLMIARAAEDSDTVLDIDTWLMSCRVIGRMVEPTMLHHLCTLAIRAGYSDLRGSYLPTAKNAMVADVYERHGFTRCPSAVEGATSWTYNLAVRTDQGRAHRRRK